MLSFECFGWYMELSHEDHFVGRMKNSVNFSLHPDDPERSGFTELDQTIKEENLSIRRYSCAYKFHT